MKKRHILVCGIIAVTTSVMVPLHATMRRASCTAGTVDTEAAGIYVDTLDVDTAVVAMGDADDADGNGEADTDDNDEFSFASANDTLPWPQNMLQRIDDIFQNTTIFNTSMVGMKIYDLTADSTLFELNARQLLRPASTLKMMVAVTAMDRLGTDYSINTRVGYTGQKDSLTLDGNIYCKGGFDPTIANGDISDIVDSIAALGIDTIKGDICLDLTMKDRDRLGEGWCWDDKNPVLSPLLVGRKDEFGDRLTRRLRQKGIVFMGKCIEENMPGNTQMI